jgi:hypothetical protein
MLTLGPLFVSQQVKAQGEIVFVNEIESPEFDNCWTAQ